jgi:hypothetical protein
MDDDFVREVESIVRSEPEKGGVIAEAEAPGNEIEKPVS